MTFWETSDFVFSKHSIPLLRKFSWNCHTWRSTEYSITFLKRQTFHPVPAINFPEYYMTSQNTFFHGYTISAICHTWSASSANSHPHKPSVHIYPSEAALLSMEECRLSTPKRRVCELKGLASDRIQTYRIIWLRSYLYCKFARLPTFTEYILNGVSRK